MIEASEAVMPSDHKGLPPYSLKNAPSFLERQFPVGRLSAEAYKERKAVAGQTLTALGSYWKGRKPLILVRAVILAALLPATDNAAADLDVFLKLMAMDDDAFGRRYGGSATEFAKILPQYAHLVTEEKGRRRVWREDLDVSQVQSRIAEAFASLTYSAEARLKDVRRPKECDEAFLLKPIWPAGNSHLGTTAGSLPELGQQLGVARFGHNPRLADTFCGGGSVPFEAARVGCDVYASDLNPIACMLTWGAFNIIGASKERRVKIEQRQRELLAQVEDEMSRLEVEYDAQGNRAKAYLYCLETRCPKTGWMVPMSPSWVIAPKYGVIAKLAPDHTSKRYDIEIQSGVSASELAEAENGTVRDGRLVHPMNPERSGVEIKVIRGDYRDENGVNRNRLRMWEKSDFVPRAEDIFQERLYCIQWITQASLNMPRQETFFATITADDIDRERRVEAIVRENLATWQQDGLVPDMAIEPGANTTQPIRERGWTHWHHLFGARALLLFATMKGAVLASDEPEVLAPSLCNALDNNSRLCQWLPSQGGGGGGPKHVFVNQALNTLLNYPYRASGEYESLVVTRKYSPEHVKPAKVKSHPASDVTEINDLYVTDPPYADAINYHEITEYFLSWLRKPVLDGFAAWPWDSRRALAIHGRDEKFRRDMVAAYAAMTQHMPDNGLQVVMFTHQDAGVWADLAGILWAAGLRVSAAWNVVTETEKPSGEGNYVQGTVCLVLRKRIGSANARRMEIEAEIEDEVKAQLAELMRASEQWTGETLYTDGDLTLAAYAAALRVVTGYATIDRRDVGADVFRTLRRGEATPLRELIDYAASVANRELVPQGFPKEAWRDVEPASRFYVRMLDMEARGSARVADFQNFAKSFAFTDYASLMGSTTANAACLAGAETLKGRAIGDPRLATQPLFQVLFAIWKTLEKGDPRVGVTLLKTEIAEYWSRRLRLADLADYVATKTARTRPEESKAAALLAEALKVDRV